MLDSSGERQPKSNFIRIQSGSSMGITSILTCPTRRDIPEDASLHSHRRENLKSYVPHARLLLRFLFDPVDGSDIFLRNVVRTSADYMTYLTKCSKSALWVVEVLHQGSDLCRCWREWVRFTGALGFVHCPGLKPKTWHFGNWICFHPQVMGEDSCSVGSLRKN
jgi:hypothetical protein